MTATILRPLEGTLHTATYPKRTLDAASFEWFDRLDAERCRLSDAALLLDLAKVARVDEAGLSVLVEYLRRWRSAAIVSARRRPAQRIREFDLDLSFPLFGDASEALASTWGTAHRLAGMTAVVFCHHAPPDLGPLIADRPLALVPVAGRRLIDRTLGHLHDYGIDDVILTFGHLGAQLPQTLGRTGPNGQRLSYFNVATPSGVMSDAAIPTAIQATTAALSGDVLLVHADQSSDICLASLFTRHRMTGAALTVAGCAVPPGQSAGRPHLAIDRKRRFLPPDPDLAANAPQTLLTAAGFAIISEAARDTLHSTTAGPVETSLATRLERSGAHVEIFDDDFDWACLRSLSGFGRFHLRAARSDVGEPAAAEGGNGVVPASVEKALKTSPHIQLNYVGDAKIGTAARLDRCVVLDGAHVPAGAHIRDRIIGPGWSHDLSSAGSDMASEVRIAHS